jgi:acyl carrier protein
MTKVHDRLEEVLRSVFNDDDIVIQPDMVPGDISGWDSLAHVSLLASIEQAFGVEFSDQELSEMADLGQVELTLERKLAP